MQSLLLDRATSRISPVDFATTLTESLYSTLKQIDRNTFPANCHSGAAVNTLSLDNDDHRYLLSGCADSSIKLWDVRPQAESEDTGKHHETSGNDDNGDDDDEENDDGNVNSSPTPMAPPRPYQLLATIPRRAGHQYGVSSVHWWPQDTGIFLSGSFDHTVKVWDTNKLEVAHTFDMASRVYAIDVCSHLLNKYAALALAAVASDQPFIRILDLRSGSSSHTLEGHKGKTLSVAWHPNRPYLLASGGYDGESKVWDIRRSKSCVCRLDMTKTNAREAKVDALNLGATSVKAHSGPVNAVAWDELGLTLYTAGNDDKVRVWDMVSTMAPPVNRLVNFGPLTRNKYLQNLPLVLSPRRETEIQHLLFPSDSGDVLVFRAVDGKLVSRLLRSGSKSTVRTASITYGGPWSTTYYCGTMDGEIITWRGFMNEYEELEDSDVEDDVEMVKEPVSREHLFDDPYFKHVHT